MTAESLIDRAYPELRLDRAASWCVQRVLDIPVRGHVRGAHLGCGSGFITQNWPGQRTCGWHGVDPDADLIATAQARPFASQNYWDAFVRSGGLSSAVTAPLRLDYSFRHAPLHETGIRSNSIDRVVLEWGHRELGDAEAIATEVQRIGRASAIICLVHHHPLEIESWSLNDALHPMLKRIRLAYARSTRAFERFGFTQSDPGERFYATARLDLADLARHLDASPELSELGVGRLSFSLGHTPLRKLWGQPKTPRNVRRRITVWTGSLPARPNELSGECP